MVSAEKLAARVSCGECGEPGRRLWKPTQTNQSIGHLRARLRGEPGRAIAGRCRRAGICSPAGAAQVVSWICTLLRCIP